MGCAALYQNILARDAIHYMRAQLAAHSLVMTGKSYGYTVDTIVVARVGMVFMMNVYYLGSSSGNTNNSLGRDEERLDYL
jgi:hypothetical protein